MEIKIMILGVILGINVGIAVSRPHPITIGCATVTGCMFLIALVHIILFKC